MKITRRQLRQLINEAMYKFGRAPRTIDHELKMFDRGREQSNTRIDSMMSPRARDNLADFDEKDPEYAEELRLGLDPDRPEISRLRQTFHTVSFYHRGYYSYDAGPDGVEEIKIPQELVNDLIDAHLKAKTGVFGAGGSVFRQAAIRVFQHIEDEVKRIAGNDMDVYEYGVGLRPVRGYRAREYEEAMEAAGEYI